MLRSFIDFQGTQNSIQKTWKLTKDKRGLSEQLLVLEYSMFYKDREPFDSVGQEEQAARYLHGRIEDLIYICIWIGNIVKYMKY